MRGKERKGDGKSSGLFLGDGDWKRRERENEGEWKGERKGRGGRRKDRAKPALPIKSVPAPLVNMSVYHTVECFCCSIFRA